MYVCPQKPEMLMYLCPQKLEMLMYVCPQKLEIYFPRTSKLLNPEAENGGTASSVVKSEERTSDECQNSLNPLNAELNLICYLLALLAHHFLHVSRIRVKSLTLRLLMSYIYIYIYIYI